MSLVGCWKRRNTTVSSVCSRRHTRRYEPWRGVFVAASFPITASSASCMAVIATATGTICFAAMGRAGGTFAILPS
jgi:hypothetical protein